jgi:ABC-type cobalamin/Fe3+-siderophores transport system ATPase subunit
MEIDFNHKRLTNLAAINVILGKNGCGKSVLLRELDASRTGWSHVKYLSPERGGSIIYAPGIDDDMNRNEGYLDSSRRKNHDENFRQKSMVQLRQLEILVNRKMSKDVKVGRPVVKHFDDVIESINALLGNIYLQAGDKAMPDIKGRLDGTIRTNDQLSSGEKELISLAVEILAFIYSLENSEEKIKRGLLLLDEPDVHLHPDLQYKFIDLLGNSIAGLPITVIISTHSTAILGALTNKNAHVYFMKAPEPEIKFASIDKELKDILPIFGAHPLSNVYSQHPILLVEGEDDERIWQQAVRSSSGRISVWPCQTGSITKLNSYEKKAAQIIDAVYDNAVAYSLRDRDDGPYEIEDIPNIVRARLNCYAAENLMLSDDVLALMEVAWNDLKAKITNWLNAEGKSHLRHAQMSDFAKDFNRRDCKVKGLEVIFLYLVNKSKPWEVLVGQAIAGLNDASSNAEGSLRDFLGEKIVTALKLNYQSNSQAAVF